MRTRSASARRSMIARASATVQTSQLLDSVAIGSAAGVGPSVENSRADALVAVAGDVDLDPHDVPDLEQVADRLQSTGRRRSAAARGALRASSRCRSDRGPAARRAPDRARSRPAAGCRAPAAAPPRAETRRSRPAPAPRRGPGADALDGASAVMTSSTPDIAATARRIRSLCYRQPRHWHRLVSQVGASAVGGEAEADVPGVAIGEAGAAGRGPALRPERGIGLAREDARVSGR